MSDATPVVYIVDDDASFLAATARLLRASGFVVKTFSSGSDFLAGVAPDARGCAIVDLRMPTMNGLDIQAALLQGGYSLPIVFLTGHGDISTSVRAMRTGAEDFLEKRAPKEQLIGSVHRALDRDARERARRAHVQELRVRFNLLTDREREVLGHVLRGRLNKQIAADLGIQERTVKLHRAAITVKLGARSIAQWTRLAHEAGMFAENGAFTKGQ